MSDLLVVTTLGMREVIRLMSRLFIVTGNEGICLLVYKAQERAAFRQGKTGYEQTG
jgi:hypothetical protein